MVRFLFYSALSIGIFFVFLRPGSATSWPRAILLAGLLVVVNVALGYALSNLGGTFLRNDYVRTILLIAVNAGVVYYMFSLVHVLNQSQPITALWVGTFIALNHRQWRMARL